LTGSPWSILFFFNQNDVVLVKKKTKANGLQSGLAGSTHRVTPGFSFPYFFLNPAWFQPRIGRVPGRLAGPGFKTMILTSHYLLGWSFKINGQAEALEALDISQLPKLP
jgi:hypothetical protein